MNENLVKEFTKQYFNESFGEDKVTITRFMKKYGFDVKDNNEFFNDFMMTFGHGPYNYTEKDPLLVY